ncbi:prepilin-type N-terminal cleavage/methylation domain-containing protein [Vibrio sp. HN007]|uniref:type IV pilus modification PilV family protein n=1 Tax=Vibrio iocasae TaxID=3098914 RepID=UPI0035D47D0D
MAAKTVKGFTLIESVVAIVVMAFAMLSLVTFLFPEVENSARPHYEVRASALAQSLMTEVISKGFDESSDPDGGYERCGEGSRVCTLSGSFGPDGAETVGSYNDVDDYIGCWSTNSHSETYCSGTPVGNLSDIFGTDISTDYPNFAANVAVFYENGSELSGTKSEVIKRVQIDITAGEYGTYTYSAYRGNY